MQKVEAEHWEVEPGETIKLVGNNFGKDLSKLEVTVEDKEAEITKAEDTSLEIKMPKDIVAGSHKLVVKNRDTKEESQPVEIKVVEHIKIPAKTKLAFRIMSPIGSETSHSGDKVSMVLASPLLLNGRIIAASGNGATGRVTFVEQPGKVKGRAAIGFTAESIDLETGETLAITTNDFSSRVPSGKKKDAKKIAITTGAGTVVGALIGGKKGAAIGAATGAGVGTTVVLTTKGDHVMIPKDSKIQFVLQDPVEFEIHKPLAVAKMNSEREQ
ncbi:MAG TPA: IPT/TIG domain-containing protein [Acidobacteriota bacterium]|nr:IPT/TIG domain-containing protein [Acidobacteriota bacterium]